MNKELKKMFIFNSSLIIAENASEYLFLWKLLESYPPVVAFSLSFLPTYISPIVDLVVSPIVDQIGNKFNKLKLFYTYKFFLGFVILYPLFLYIYNFKLLFLLVYIIILILSFFIGVSLDQVQ